MPELFLAAEKLGVQLKAELHAVLSEYPEAWEIIRVYLRKVYWQGVDDHAQKEITNNQGGENARV